MRNQLKSPPPWRLCHNERRDMFVILNEVKNLIELIG
jgi:hypothetical protein